MTQQPKTSEEIFHIVNSHETQSGDEFLKVIRKKWLPADEVISLELHKAMQDENFEQRNQIAVFQRDFIPKERVEEFRRRYCQCDFGNSCIHCKAINKILLGEGK